MRVQSFHADAPPSDHARRLRWAPGAGYQAGTGAPPCERVPTLRESNGKEIMAKRKTGKGSSESKAPAKRPAKRKVVAARSKKPAKKAAKAAPRKAVSPKKAIAPKKAPAPKKLTAQKPIVRPGLRRPVKSRTSVTRLAAPLAVADKYVLAAARI